MNNMSNVSKGRKVENLAAKFLLSHNYQVHQTIRSKFHNNDVFGCFDIVATNGYELRFIQVESNQFRSSKSREIDTINLPVCGGNDCRIRLRKELWVYKKSKRTPSHKFMIYFNDVGWWYHARSINFKIIDDKVME